MPWPCDLPLAHALPLVLCLWLTCILSDDSYTYCTERFDRAFWMGDLNYRIDGTRKMVDTLVAEGLIEVMIANDQVCLRAPFGRSRMSVVLFRRALS